MSKEEIVSSKEEHIMLDCENWSVAKVQSYFQEIGVDIIFIGADGNEYSPQDDDLIISQSLEKDHPIEQDCLPLIFQVSPHLSPSDESDMLSESLPLQDTSVDREPVIDEFEQFIVSE